MIPWSAMGDGLISSVLALVRLPDGRIVAGLEEINGRGVEWVWDGTTWAPLAGQTDNAVSGITLSPSGDMLVTGRFMVAGDQPSAYFARYALGSTADFDRDGDSGTDRDIEAFFACLAGHCCVTCEDADFDGDGVVGGDADIESFFRVLAGGGC